MLTASLFLLTTLLALVFFYYGTGRSGGVVILFAGWGMAVLLAALTGIFQRHPLTFLAVVAGSLVCTALGYRLLRGCRIHMVWLLAVHALRILVELVLYRLYLERKVPELMTFRGWNYDIATGITAALLLVYATAGKKPRIGRGVLIAWNVTGLILLTAIVVLAVLSAPLPLQRLAFSQPNVAVLAAPYCLLPAVVVPLVCLAHLVMLLQPRSRWSE